MKYAFLGRQPILDKNAETIFYSLMFRKNHSREEKLKDYAPAYAELLSQLLQSFDLDTLLEGKRGWVKIDDQTLIKTDLTLLDKEHLLFELTDTSHFSGKLSKIIEPLIDAGYHFALAHTLIDEVIEKRGEDFVGLFDYIVFNVRKLDFDILHKHERLFKRLDMPLVATRVETKAGFEMCKRLGFSYFMGHYFEQVEIIKSHKLSAQKSTLLQLLSLLKSEADMSELVRTIRFDPSLSLQLLKYVNSAAFTTKEEIVSIDKAVSLLGRDKLNGWVSLNLFSADEGELKNAALIETALMRARMMELLSETLGRKEYQEQAYIVGLLSLIDAFLGVSMREIAKESVFSKAVCNALIHGEGELGKILKLVIVIESGSFKKIELISKKLKIDLEKLSMMLQSAYAYVNEVKAELS